MRMVESDKACSEVDVLNALQRCSSSVDVRGLVHGGTTKSRAVDVASFLVQETFAVA